MDPAHGSKSGGDFLGGDDSTLLDLIDNLLNKGVVVNGDVILSVADVDLIYLRLGVLLCAADRILPGKAGRRTTESS